jgi:GT2 family glycosyltransferase
VHLSHARTNFRRNTNRRPEDRHVARYPQHPRSNQLTRTAPTSLAGQAGRPHVHGRSLLTPDGEKLHVRGATYGTFAPTNGSSFPDLECVRRDFQAMSAAGITAVRTYVVPSAPILDAAADAGLWVMVGLAWEQHVAFLEDPRRARDIVARIGRQVRECHGHPAILCYAIGNEIPAAIVRWHGKRPIERFLQRLHWEAKERDPGGLFTYVNYPSTEYLELPFLDLVAFNVFIEREAAFETYIARLQNLSGNRPLLVTEVGLDSRRNGPLAQARALRCQVRHAFASGAAGVFVFSWTDEWHRGGTEITDWDFGIVDRERRPKPALAAVDQAFANVPFRASRQWPKVSVVVCTHNGERTLPECLSRLRALRYPDFETIVVCDGSCDRSPRIAREHGAIVIETSHRGLSHARNSGIARATGEIVAFLDDDAYPDADWLHYIADGLRDGRYAGVGGPNIPPQDGRLVPDAVAAAPGGPIHVLVSDREAEHLPGCNMAFRTSALKEIDGFDERFRTAGDDVDVCWRLQKAGKRLGFSPGAVVMHRRRDSVARYLRQQFGYGAAEALLERKWPARYNRSGASRWTGRIYEQQLTPGSRPRPLIRYGTWGTGLFQSICYPPPSTLTSLLRMPESLMLLALFGVVSALGLFWGPLLMALAPLVGILAWMVAEALAHGWSAHPATPARSRLQTLERRLLTSLLFVLQPCARLAGRLRNGLSPWRRRLRPGAASPRPRTINLWSEVWREPQARIEQLQDALAARGGFVRSGGPFDRWDLEVRTGPLGGVKLRVAVEEHGCGTQLVRARIWPRVSVGGVLVTIVLALLGALAWQQGRLGVATVIGATMLVLIGLVLEGDGTAMSFAIAQIEALADPPSTLPEVSAAATLEAVPA